ncbi:hypothetical protein BDV96DRAFT_573786 [Lophiotrema nucula]|uniref:Uncharacterized protein n=1 Tax=Lophiotrema nucula TaxID=690887 RepID=A0A6A5ZAN3_9PLEO|nr:hypothetical protein BDV96DRAFT_573786 [Lophiotrema nucula]
MDTSKFQKLLDKEHALLFEEKDFEFIFQQTFAALGSKAEYREFVKFSTKCQFERHSRSSPNTDSNPRAPPYIPSCDEYFKVIQETNYRDEDHLNRLIMMLDAPAMPYIGLGKIFRTHYRLSPNPRVLAPSIDLPHRNDPRQLLPETLLGVNTNIWHPVGHPDLKRRRERGSDETVISVSSGETDVDDRNGFVFHQLGLLEYYEGPLTTEEFVKAPLQQIVDGPWQSTGFAVVVKISGAKGDPGEIWIIFNFKPEDEDGDRHAWENETEWGQLPEHNTNCGMVKIADSLEELGHGKNINRDILSKIASNVDLVRVVKSSLHRFIIRREVGKKK